MGTRLTERQRIALILARVFPGKGDAPNHFGDLLSGYADSGIGPPHLVSEIETCDEGKLWSCVWEAMLYRHFRSHGYDPKGSVKGKKQYGPDFRIEHEGQTIWIEAVVPAPVGIPLDYLEPPRPGGEVRARKKPDVERVLRCTSAIADKRRKFETYQAEGLITATDCTVIALNICRLSDWDFEGTGISQWPLSVEAVFPVGPLVAFMTRDGKFDGPVQNVHRFSVQKAGGQQIETAAFLNPTFANISAVIQAHQKDTYRRSLSLATIHNPLASVQLSNGLLGADKEFVAKAQGDEYQLRDIRFEARIRERVDSLRRRFREREDQLVRLFLGAESAGYVGHQNKCHENVRRWCFIREHFRHTPVRGWLISGGCVLDKHSVVDIGDGDLVDVTPMPDDARRTFLVHDGTEDEFCAMPNQIILLR